MPSLPFWAVVVIYNALGFYWHSGTIPFSLFSTIMKFWPYKIDFDIVGIP